ncbi:hypothetical protein ACFE04_000999 [Oxalis oulophora]
MPSFFASGSCESNGWSKKSLGYTKYEYNLRWNKLEPKDEPSKVAVRKAILQISLNQKYIYIKATSVGEGDEDSDEVDIDDADGEANEGEAPADCILIHDFHLHRRFSNGFPLKSKPIIVISDKEYVIHESALALEVNVFDKTAAQWVTPTVLGTKPKTGRGYSAVSVNEDRILIINKGSTSDDCIWFLEVNTQYVREQKKVLGTEVVAWSKGVLGSCKKPVVISGPSGVGKGTLISMLMTEFPSMFGFSVSHTTRAPRGMETNGVHYHFTDRSVMEKEIKDGKFLEFANVHGNLYGTSMEAVEVVADSGKRCILDIDVQGARSVKASTLEAIFIFVSPPSMQELEGRLRSRGTETEEQIQKRLRNAKAEIEQGTSSGIFDHMLYNDNLEECYEDLKKILGLDGGAGVTQITSSRGIDLPEEYSLTKAENKIIINCGSSELEKAPKNLRMVLDLSVLKGGAPGRTRGLNLYAVDSFSDSLNDHTELWLLKKYVGAVFSFGITGQVWHGNRKRSCNCLVPVKALCFAGSSPSGTRKINSARIDKGVCMCTNPSLLVIGKKNVDHLKPTFA